MDMILQIEIILNNTWYFPCGTSALVKPIVHLGYDSENSRINATDAIQQEFLKHNTIFAQDGSQL